jgi:MFS family permease
MAAAAAAYSSMTPMRRIAAASMVGTMLEYFDFAVYNSLAALVFNRIFFPSFEPLAGTILAFATFAVGYLARPFGGVLFGRLGDRHGRRYVLMATLLLMGMTTVAMGLLPTYQDAGLMSPVLLVSLRFVQGAALGGEWAGAVLLALEHGDPRRRGLNGAWAQMGPSLGTLLATGFIAVTTASMPAESFQQRGWRLPFLASAALIAFGLWLRTGVEETPLFEQLRAGRAVAQAPVREVVTSHWRALLVAGGARIGPDVLYSLLVAFTLSYLATVLHRPRSLALVAVSIGCAFSATSIPLFGALSDRRGRRPVYGTGLVLMLALGFSYFQVLDSQAPWLICLAVALGFVIHAAMYGPQAAFIAEQFPTRVRYVGSSLAYTFVGIIGGGLAPMAFAALLRATGSTLALSVYLAVAATLSGVALLVARETSDASLD